MRFIFFALIVVGSLSSQAVDLQCQEDDASAIKTIIKADILFKAANPTGIGPVIDGTIEIGFESLATVEKLNKDLTDVYIDGCKVVFKQLGIAIPL